MKICLNMIVRNERAIIERCLASVAAYVSSYVIADTGSTDGTQAAIKAFFDARGIPGEIVEFPFEDFAQARNGALDAAESSVLESDYFLLVDADMEMLVDDATFFDRLTASAYSVPQRTGHGLDYDNVRLIKRGIGARYIGVTHEYVNTPDAAPERSTAISFLDHACGSNRADKAERDIRLLRKGLEAEPENPRYHFYLAQTLREIGQFEEARDLYTKRAAMTDFEEEAWYSAMCAAICERALGNEEAFEVKMLAAWQRRPHRSETLYHLAAHYMAKGKNSIATMLAAEGLRIPFPKDDVLFKEGGVYKSGFKTIYSISGFYDKRTRPDAFYYCNWLALNRDVSEAQRVNARQNLQHYLTKIDTYLPSWKASKIDFLPPDGWHATNASVCNVGGFLDVIVRTVNYKVDFRPEGAFYVTPGGAPITTRNYLINLDQGLKAFTSKEIMPPPDMPPPKYDGILGFEDLRLAYRDGERVVNGTICETTEDGWRNMAIARLDGNDGGATLREWRHVVPSGTPRQAEKNWMPVLLNGKLCYLYSCDPVRIVDANGDTVLLREQEISATSFRGGSQLVPFEDGRLCLVHEVAINAQQKRRTYFHRFVWFDNEFVIKRVSPPFVFNAPRFEFAAGLAWVDTKRMAVSYGVDDCEAWLGTFDAKDMAEFLQDCSEYK